VVKDASGNVVGEQRYTPFGETRVSTGSLFTDHLYTGQREMVDIGLYHYGARFYSPKLGRFISPDSIVPGAGNPQALNRYSYVLNNPILFNDPTGHVVACETGDVCKDWTSLKPPSKTSSSGMSTVVKHNQHDSEDVPGIISTEPEGGMLAVEPIDVAFDRACQPAGMAQVISTRVLGVV